MEHGQAGRPVRLVHELVAARTTGGLVAGVIQLDRQGRLHGPGVAQQEVHVFARDLVTAALPITPRGCDEQHVRQPHHGAYRQFSAHCRPEHVVERQLRVRQELVLEPIRRALGRRRHLAKPPDQGEQTARLLSRHPVLQSHKVRESPEQPMIPNAAQPLSVLSVAMQVVARRGRRGAVSADDRATAGLSGRAGVVDPT